MLTHVMRLALPMVAATVLAGCGMISHKFSEAASQMPGIGLPADAPERTAEPAAYPAVHDMPAPRNTVTLTAIERADAERQLVEARNEQQGAGAAIRAGADDPREPKIKEREAREKIQKDKLRKAQAAQ